MERDELIRKVMEEVKDEGLRGDLLRTLTKGGGVEGRSNVIRELERMGLNPGGVKNYVGFQLTANIVGAYIVSAVFAIVGMAFMTSGIWGVPIGLVILLFAVFGFVNADKMRQMKG